MISEIDNKIKYQGIVHQIRECKVELGFDKRYLILIIPLHDFINLVV